MYTFTHSWDIISIKEPKPTSSERYKQLYEQIQSSQGVYETKDACHQEILRRRKANVLMGVKNYSRYNGVKDIK